jgi:hypothetical protein
MSSRSVCVILTLVVSALLLVSQPVAAQEAAVSSFADEQLSAIAKSPSNDCMAGLGVGATLLIPYFEVDLTTGSLTTLVAVGNHYSSPTLCRVVLWTDWGIPSLAFDIYLTSYDIVTFNVRDIFFAGNLPSTGETANLSGFPFCGSWPPYHSNPVIGSGDLDKLAEMHTGAVDSITKLCSGEDHGDNIARGYITIDVVDECSGREVVNPVFTPANTDYPYFAEGGASSGIATAENRLWGDYFYVDDANNFAQATEAVAIWADPGEFTGTGIYTFYGRYSDWDGRDERVPLPSAWQNRFLDGGPFAGGASVIVWRDTNSADIDSADCELGPSWWPLTTSFGAVDEDGGNNEVMDADSVPLAAQRLAISSLDLPLAFGWMRISTGNAQTWIQPSLAAFGRFSASFNGTPYMFLCGNAPPASK